MGDDDGGGGFGGGSDGGGSDSGSSDSGSSDSGFGGGDDSGSSNSGSTDTNGGDTSGSTDTGSTDTSSTDTGNTDTSSTDSGFNPAGFDTGSGFTTTGTGLGSGFGTGGLGTDSSTGGFDTGRFGGDGLGSSTGFGTGSSPDGSSLDGTGGLSGFSVSPAALSDVSTSLGSLIGDGQNAVSGLSSLSLDPSAYGLFGSPVATVAQTLMGQQTSALGSTLSGLDTVNTNIGLSNAGYLDADQAISQGFGGLPDTTGTTPATTVADTTTQPTTPGLPTFANLPPDQAAAVDTLNAQAQQTPANLADDQAMQAQLALHEDSRTHVYTDTMGHPSVGIGFNLDRSGARDAISAVGADYDAVRAGTQDLTQDQITQLAHTDTAHAVDVARNYYSGFDQLDPARQRALVDMTFNLDNKINQFTGLHQALVNGDYDAAANHISSSLFARQTGNRGVDLTNQMRNGGQ